MIETYIPLHHLVSRTIYYICSITAKQENENNSNNGPVSPNPIGQIGTAQPYRDSSHSPEITDDVFSPESNMQTEENSKLVPVPVILGSAK